jgi:hypothetical protein
MFMEEQNKDRVNVKRTKQLLNTGADTVASACPFCMTMLTDGIKAEAREESVKNLVNGSFAGGDGDAQTTRPPDGFPPLERAGRVWDPRSRALRARGSVPRKLADCEFRALGLDSRRD